ncbi:hypothetical protein TruAng_005993 [Truncatella angustata]|nr:hypothetical protein TruAng_005993 [Truncatella angustata]
MATVAQVIEGLHADPRINMNPMPADFLTYYIELFKIELQNLIEKYGGLKEILIDDKDTGDSDEGLFLANPLEDPAYMRHNVSIYYAMHKNYVGVTKIILRAWSQLHPTIMGYGDYEIHHELHWLQPLLNYAVEKASPEIVQHMLEKGANPNRRYTGSWLCQRSMRTDHNWHYSKIEYPGLRYPPKDALEVAMLCSGSKISEYLDRDMFTIIALQIIQSGYEFGEDLYAKFRCAAELRMEEVVRVLWPKVIERETDPSKLLSLLNLTLRAAIRGNEKHPTDNTAVLKLLLEIRSGITETVDKVEDGNLVEFALRLNRNPANLICLLRHGLVNQPPTQNKTQSAMAEHNISALLSKTPDELLSIISVPFQNLWELLEGTENAYTLVVPTGPFGGV